MPLQRKKAHQIFLCAVAGYTVIAAFVIGIKSFQSHIKTETHVLNDIVTQGHTINKKPWSPNTAPTHEDANDKEKSGAQTRDSGSRYPVKTTHDTALPHTSSYINMKLRVDVDKSARRHLILWWNRPGWMGRRWNSRVNMGQCEYTNCFVTTDKQLFMDASVVLFSLADGGISNKPPLDISKRNPDQPWVFFTLESPAVLHKMKPETMSPNWHNVFNWSWTYRQDSDIYHPYGMFQTRLPQNIPTKNYREIFRKKTKEVAWLVSHCPTFGQREDFVTILSKYIHIDIYGRCGKGEKMENFKEVISRDYKFYIGFENAFCTDYVTEKMFNYYKKDLITIVRGRINYSAKVPNGTVINTADFPNIKALADHLNILSSDEDAYIGYLERKDKYEVHERIKMYRNALCHMCEKLNNLESNRRTYRDIYEWIGKCYAVNDLIET